MDQRRVGKLGKGEERQLSMQRLGHALRRYLLAHDLAVLHDPIIRAVRLHRDGEILRRLAGDLRIAFQIPKRLVDLRDRWWKASRGGAHVRAITSNAIGPAPP